MKKKKITTKVIENSLKDMKMERINDRIIRNVMHEILKPAKKSYKPFLWAIVCLFIIFTFLIVSHFHLKDSLFSGSDTAFLYTNLILGFFITAALSGFISSIVKNKKIVKKIKEIIGLYFDI